MWHWARQVVPSKARPGQEWPHLFEACSMPPDQSTDKQTAYNWNPLTSNVLIKTLPLRLYVGQDWTHCLQHGTFNRSTNKRFMMGKSHSSYNKTQNRREMCNVHTLLFLFNFTKLMKQILFSLKYTFLSKRNWLDILKKRNVIHILLRMQFQIWPRIYDKVL